MSPQDMLSTIGEIMPIVVNTLNSYGFRDHCIQGSALLTTVLHRAGMPGAYPLTVGARILNEAFQRYVDIHGMPLDEASGKACDDAGGVTIILGRGAPEVSPDQLQIQEDKWLGHLAVIVPGAFGEKHALLDPTITQAHRPEFGVVMQQPLCSRVPEEFVLGGRIAKFDVNKTLVMYQAYPDDRSYNDDGDCMKKPGLDEAASMVLRRMRR